MWKVCTGAFGVINTLPSTVGCIVCWCCDGCESHGQGSRGDGGELHDDCCACVCAYISVDVSLNVVLQLLLELKLYCYGYERKRIYNREKDLLYSNLASTKCNKGNRESSFTKSWHRHSSCRTRCQVRVLFSHFLPWETALQKIPYAFDPETWAFDSSKLHRVIDVSGKLLELWSLHCLVSCPHLS